MTTSHIKTFRVNDKVITQSINLENDSVIFTDSETNKIIFIMTHDCKTFYYNKDNDKIFLGKFSYTDIYSIKFVYDVSFTNKYPIDPPINKTITFVTDDENSLPINDFIKAEEIFVKTLLTNYPNVFNS